MADTIQIVSWALGQTCRLRDADARLDPVAALGRVRLAQTYAKHLNNTANPRRIVGDVLVTARKSAETPKRLRDRGFSYPSYGFVLSEAFADTGGAAGLVAMCRDCPGNTRTPAPAGCAGTLYQNPTSPQTQAQLESIISRLGLEVAMRDAFPMTTPIWYGLWAQSPLTPRAAELLRVVLAEMRREDALENPGSDHVAELDAFCRAAEHAERFALPLAVRMAPPGHADMGWDTTFPHCPFCKAEAPVGRWRRKYPIEHIACAVCGTRYSPAETASSDRWGEMGQSLEEMLGPERFLRVATAYLVAQGATPAEAAEIVALTQGKEAERAAFNAARQKRWNDADRYVRAVVYAGLSPHALPDEVDDGSDEPVAACDWFTPTEFREVLTRCERLGIRITAMHHVSDGDESLDRYSSLSRFDPAKLFAEWLASGCREHFRAAFKVPDARLDAWLAEQ